MKLNLIAAALALAASGAGLAAPTDLGVLDAAGTNFDASFWRVFSFGSPLGAFTDHYTFTLSSNSTASGGTIVFDWGSLGLQLTSLKLSGGNLGAAGVIDTTPDTFAFSSLGAGTYYLDVSGNLSASSGFVGLAHYEGSIQALGAPVPEPEHYAMMFAGLAGLGWLVKRRQSA